ncbi:hypothetical protein B0J15DRAFT_457498 [Fusarium solani]|uniref:Uncharacterized protein n=1 Tax=Fusarium solani TaxID=169388 RepID=A0A9P9L6W9_FUSSL|nr:uncharacterized protein B0J15DRAFT_457498 [Fusarium solani]KAH7275323.1 hypothetical protein B0J15DRAFT_457498 [Fusarium solani]
MDSKQVYTAQSNYERATSKSQESGREAARCEQWDDTANTWHKPKSSGHSNGSGRVRKREEYEDGEEKRARLAWALKNWPTRDIPIPSIETPDEELEVSEPKESESEESEEPAPKRQKSMPVDKFEILWHYLENNTPDMRSPTLFPSLSPVSDLDDSPHDVGTDASLDSSSLTETTVTADDGEIAHCGEEAESDRRVDSGEDVILMRGRTWMGGGHAWSTRVMRL